MKHIICGMGEVGTALANVIRRSRQEAIEHDPPKEKFCTDATGSPVLHICLPFSEGFIANVKHYQNVFCPMLTIIHSTVSVGTTREIGGVIVHSPVHGVHPNLEEGLIEFTKMVGAINLTAQILAGKVLEDIGLSVAYFSSPEASEMSKIMCTTQYAWNVILCKEIAAECDRLGVPFEEVYSIWNAEYNRGYDRFRSWTKSSRDVHRPVLEPMPGPIGGHCLIPNAKLHKCWLTETILKRNEAYK